MITLIIILALAGMLVMGLVMGAVVLIDPIICILVVVGIVKGLKMLFGKKK